MSLGKLSVGGKPVLILGGTREARELAARLVDLGVDVTSSLAGRTANPVLPAGKVRIGGFGGAQGLADYLAANAISLLVDATHPFAAQISKNAAKAAAAIGIPLMRLTRPQWEMPFAGAWQCVSDLQAGAATLPEGANVFLAIGRQELASFHARADCRFVARVIDEPDTIPEGWTLITARGPFALDDERALFAKHAITHLVTKNSGGIADTKLHAAQQSNVGIIMVERPELPPAPTFNSVEDVVNTLSR